MMFITQSTTHTPCPDSVHFPRPQAHVSRVRRCGSVLSGDPAVQGLHATCKGWGAAAVALRLRVVRLTYSPLVGCSVCWEKRKFCSQQARVVVSKVEEPGEEEEKRSEEKIRFLGHPRPTARLHQQVLVVQWKKRPDLAEQQQRRQQQNRRSKKLGQSSR